MHEPDTVLRRGDRQRVIGTNRANGVAIDGDLGLGLCPLEQADLDHLVRGDDDWPVRQGVRANRDNNERVQLRLDDRPAAAQGIRSRAGRRGDDQAIARVYVDELAGDRRLEIDHAPGAVTLHHNIIEACCGNRRARRRLQLRVQQQARLDRVFAGQDEVDAVDHLVGRDVGKKAEPAAVDAEQGDTFVAGEGAGVEHRAVATDRYDEVGGARQLAFVQPGDRKFEPEFVACEDLDASCR